MSTAPAGIVEHVRAELAWEPRVDASGIVVSVEDGVVQLTGSVRSVPQKRAAVSAAQRVTGVRAVADELEVLLPGERQRSDADIAGAIASALEWDDSVPHTRLTVAVRDGWVTLGGSVDWQYEREAALRATEQIIGVRGITDEIVVQPTAKAPQVHRLIEAALRRHWEPDAARIDVRAHDGEVILTGTVRHISERDHAAQAAWAAPGVHSVRNEIEVRGS